MTTNTLNIKFEEYDSLQEMSQRDRELSEAAMEARKGSYSPYSKFQVGAALLLENGVVVKGANQENVAYPAGLCAERTAMFWASANYPGVPFVCLAISAADKGVPCEYPASPCGGCRQVMAEYQKKFGKPLEIILVGSKKIRKFSRVDDVLPFIFDSLKAE